MPIPTGPVGLRILADFTGTAYGNSPTFTDYTADVLAGLGFDPITITWGRQDQFSDITPTQAQFTFNNTTGKYTPGYSGLNLNLCPLDMAAPGSVSGTTSAFSSSSGSTLTLDTTNQLGSGHPNSVQVSIPNGVSSLSVVLLSSNVPVTAGLAYSLAVQINDVGPTCNATTTIEWKNSSGTNISGTGFGTTVTLGTTAYSTLTNVTAPAGAAFAQIRVENSGGATTSTTIFYVGNLCLTQTTTPLFETVAPLYPNVRRRVRAQVQAVISGSPVYLSDTYADSWDVVADRSQPWKSTYSGTDILGRMASDSPLRGWLAEEILNNITPSFLYPLQEPEGATSFGDLTGNQTPATIGNSKYGPGIIAAAQTPTANLQDAVVLSIANSGYAGTYPSSPGKGAGSWLSVPVPNTTGTHSFSMFVQMPATLPTNVACILSMYQYPASGGNLGSSVLLEADSFGNISITMNSASAFTVATFGAASIFDGNVHHIGWALGADGKTVALYIDGKAVSIFTGTTALGQIFYSTMPITIGLPYWNQSSIFRPFTGAYAYVGFWQFALNAGQMLDIYNAGALAAPEGLPVSTDQRITRLLTYRPNNGSVLDTGQGSMGIQDISDGDVDALTDGQGETLQQALFDCGDVEAGVVYADGQGRIVFRNRTNLYNPVPVATLDCNLGGVDVSTEFRDDIQGMVNDETVTRTGGADNRAFNQASINQDGSAATTLTLDIDTDANALLRAQWDVGVGTQEQLMVPQLVVDLLHCPTATALAVLQLRPLDCVTVINLPVGAFGSTVTVQVQGGSLSLAADAMTASLVCTPLPPLVLTADQTVNGVTVAADTADSLTYFAAL